MKEVVEHISTKKQKLEPHQSIPMIDQHFSQEEEDIYDVCDLHCLGVKFQKLYPVGTVKDFISYCQKKMKPEYCKQIEKETANQATNGKWFKLRYLYK